MFLATQRAAYEAERSTFEGSLPLNAPPPCRPMPPYVSTMILRPVSPASPCGPPITKSVPWDSMCSVIDFALQFHRNDGFDDLALYRVLDGLVADGIAVLRREMTTVVVTITGRPFSYSTVT